MTRRNAPPPAITEADMDKAIERRDKASGGWQTYACTLVTPMYGGGVEPGKVDVEMPIRASAIRGQLRFWWRIACAQGLDAGTKLKLETEIWGGIGDTSPTASKVEVRIRCAKAKATDLISSTEEGHTAIKYAFGSASINGSADWLKSGFEFQLELRYPDDIAAAVEATLRWWASFGGIGARTRRGFGATQVRSLSTPTVAEIEAIGARLTLAGTGGANPENEWKVAVDRLYAFRQKGGIARKDNKPRPGRSFWPEPDQIRRFTQRDAHGKHAPEHAAGNIFPRAAFGLPITFEFKGSPGDPPKLELHPEGEGDRMASPLILRPYWNGKQWQPAALLLPGWKAALSQRLKFKGQHYAPGPAHWPTDPTKRKQLADRIKPMAGRATDPLSAFMDFFEKGK